MINKFEIFSELIYLFQFNKLLTKMENSVFLWISLILLLSILLSNYSKKLNINLLNEAIIATSFGILIGIFLFIVG